jgi:translation initiation factor IF-2
MLDESGIAISEAGPSIPVEILGLDGTPEAGDTFMVVDSERQAREVALAREIKRRQTHLAHRQATRLDTVFSDLSKVTRKTLNVMVKADVRGSLEAIQSALADLGNEEVSVNAVAGAVGGITETDVTLALTTSAVIFGFNVRADAAARRVLEREGVEVRYYSVIYDLIDDVRNALIGMLKPELREEIMGTAEVRDTFRSPKFGTVAGCMVIEGVLLRNKPIRVLRDNVVIFQGELESLRRFKEDVNEVRAGFECGIGVRNYNDVRVGDKIEVYSVREVARTL